MRHLIKYLFFFISFLVYRLLSDRYRHTYLKTCYNFVFLYYLLVYIYKIAVLFFISNIAMVHLVGFSIITCYNICILDYQNYE